MREQYSRFNYLIKKLNICSISLSGGEENDNLFIPSMSEVLGYTVVQLNRLENALKEK